MQHQVSGLCVLFGIIAGTCVCVSSADNCSQLARTIVVDKNGGGQFQTVQAAVDAVPEYNDHWIKIQINAGVYNERVRIPSEKPCIYMEGQGAQQTIITDDEHQGTNSSATFTSIAQNFVARRLTFKNSFNHRQQRLMTSDDRITQAVAALIEGDKSAFYDCAFLGLQDTLWDSMGRHYFKDCYIEGAIDFIFGAGQSVYENCRMHATAGLLASQVPYGFITAQRRQSSSDPSGFVFQGGAITGPLRVFLGRAWGPYSRVIFHQTTMDANIDPQGWNPWNFPGQEDKFTYIENDCKGAGSDTKGRVSWMKTGLPSDFSISSFVDQDGWLDQLNSELI